MKTLVKAIAFVTIAGGAIPAYANFGNMTNYYGNKGGGGYEKRVQKVVVQRKETTAKVETKDDGGQRPVDTVMQQKRWIKRFLRQLPDDEVELTYPKELEVKLGSLPKGSRVARDAGSQLRQHGSDRVSLYKSPKTGTYAIHEQSDGENDFRVHLYDPRGAKLSVGYVRDDGVHEWEASR